ncbi:MAG: hypothetical protein WBZ24_06745 [Anaerolineales bacterium]|jgi:DNA-directed RNA polymerase specialized sigma24 family protein
MMIFDELCYAHFRDVYRFAIWLTGNPSEAEGITSETYIRA